MAVMLSPVGIQQFFGNDGRPLAGGTLLPQVGGINTLVYQDAAGTVPLPLPIPLNNRGEVSDASGISRQMFLTSGVVYTFTLFDAGGNQINQAPSVSATVAVSSVALAASGGSALVGFIQPQTGAVLRTVQSKLRDEVSVFDFMTAAQIADVIGNTLLLDVTAPINAAMSSGAKRIIFPEGSYGITAPLLWKTQTTLWAANRITCIVKALAGFAGTALINCPSDAYTGMTMEHFTLNANNIAGRCFSMVSSGQGASDSIILRDVSFALATSRPYYIELVTGLRLYDVFSNGGTDGAYLKTCFDVLAIGVTAYNGARAAFIVEGCIDSNFYNVSAFNNPGTNSTSLIEFNGGHHNNLDGYKCEAQGAANVTQELLVINSLGASNAVGNSFRNGRHRGFANTKVRSITVGAATTMYGTDFFNITGIKPAGANSVNLVQQQETWFRWCRDQVAYDTPNFAPITIDNTSGFFYNADQLQNFALTMNAAGTQPTTLVPAAPGPYPGVKNHCEFRMVANFGAIAWTGAPTGAIQVNFPFSFYGECDVQGTFFPTGVVGQINGTIMTFYAVGSATALTWGGASSGGSLVINVHGQVAA